jgi:hypothetical protein
LLAQIFSTGLLGVDAYLVEVEVDVIRCSGDQVKLSVVGLLGGCSGGSALLPS